MTATKIHVPLSFAQNQCYPVSAIRYLLSGIRYPVSAIRYPLSGIRYPVSGFSTMPLSSKACQPSELRYFRGKKFKSCFQDQAVI